VLGFRVEVEMDIGLITLENDVFDWNLEKVAWFDCEFFIKEIFIVDGRLVKLDGRDCANLVKEGLESSFL